MKWKRGQAELYKQHNGMVASSYFSEIETDNFFFFFFINYKYIKCLELKKNKITRDNFHEQEDVQ